MVIKKNKKNYVWIGTTNLIKGNTIFILNFIKNWGKALTYLIFKIV